MSNYFCAFCDFRILPTPLRGGVAVRPGRGEGRAGLGYAACRQKYPVSEEDTDPPPTRLRPTVATLPNCSLLAIAYMGGESGGGKGGKSGGGW